MKHLDCERRSDVAAYALRALPAAEAAQLQAHIAGCAQCRAELASLDTAVAMLGAWPADTLAPPASLQARLASRIAQEVGGEPFRPAPLPAEAPWDEVAPGLFCKVLAQDSQRKRASMLVKLLPNVEYPPHTHAGLEELFLLDGELWIDDRKLYPGDYNRAEAPTGDKRVWSETGCTCVLVTSTEDVLA